jgi:glycosyltransferase involved in cell wall biosynthesis
VCALRRVFHVLPECEPFSEFHGGAISRWVANVLRGDGTGVVVCVEADDSWGVSANSVMNMGWMRRYSRVMRSGYRTPWLLRKWSLRRGFRGLIEQLQAGDTVWVHNRPEVAAAICAAVRRAGARMVLHMHNLHLQTTSRKAMQELDADCIVYVSRYLEEASRSALVRPVQGEVLYNGADGELFRPKPKCACEMGKPMRVLFAARLVKEKGPHLLVEALGRLLREGVAIEGVIVGGVEFGDSQPDAYVRALQESAPSNLSFHPYCAGEALVRLFQQADVFCLPSVWDDPFPLAPLEAMATGLPVVASRSGGIPETLFDGGGILVERDSVESLTAALRALAQDQGRRGELAEQALRSFERHFRWEHVQGNYRAIVGRVADA